MMALMYVLLTVGIYWGAKQLHRLKPMLLLSPLLVTPIAVIIILALGKIPYQNYNEGGHLLSSMVGPATIALAVPMYKNAAIMKKHAFEIITGVLSGWIFGMMAALLFSRSLELSDSLIDSLLLRSTTTPIALVINDMIGGISTLTAIFVLVTGILGTIIGPLVIRVARIRSDIAKGVLMGSSAHSAGAHKAFEFGLVPGSIASIAMIATAFISLALLPWLTGLFMHG
ncbi:LrgB family protein [Paenibacillus algorifonticola]|uniref:LrgB family protein n=1 Tax=Paenibacillus algorifonticola TaxID=684063 RepID=UPI003D2BF9FE